MKRIYLGFILIVLISSCQNKTHKPEMVPIEKGVSDSLAQYRAEALSDISYGLYFNLPENRKERIPASAKISFNFKPKKNRGLQLDFKADRKHLQRISLNGGSIPIRFKKEHILLAPEVLKEGVNEVQIDFKAGDAALNRRDDFMYALFVPDRARSVFPVFDQPDLKAKFKLKLTIPEAWKATANAQVQDSMAEGNKKTIVFSETKRLSTYLFSFAAGEFQRATETFGGKEIELLYRETDSSKIGSSLPEIFRQYKEYVEFYEDWTGIDYPFQKHGMVAIPDFQFGGMEHPGAILLKSSTIFLPEEATERQQNDRAQLLAHEVAHMWFGDLVTMKWFNDVWTKEVFANFMADKATADLEDESKYALKFLSDHFPAAYGVDRTLGANPIRQKLHNLQDAGTMYGNIIYHKAPIMMQQLENMMGKSAFQAGIRDYLKSFSYANATWPELIEILDNNTAIDLHKWNQVWVDEPGRPVFDVDIALKEGKISSHTIVQKPERENDRVWPQYFDVDIHFKDGKVKRKRFNDSVAKQEIDEFIGMKNPAFIQYNPSGEGYGVMPIDTLMLTDLYHIKDKVARASAYITLYENMLNGRYLKPKELFDLFTEGLEREDEELNLQLLTDYLSDIYWVFLPKAERSDLAETIESELWKAMENTKSSHNQKVLFKAYQNIFESKAAADKLYGIWESQEPPKAIHLSPEDYTDLALSLQLRSNHPDMLDEQLKRITDRDRIKQFEIIRPAVSHNVKERDTFFKRLTDKENRSNEAAVLVALDYLHHPLYQKESAKYLKQTLALTPEIQETGDIFFPSRWLGASFGKYNSKTAYEVVQDYVEENPDLNPKLKEKILQETDNLRRAQDLIK